MFGLHACTTSILLLVVLGLAGLLLLAIAELGSRRLMRESGRPSRLVALPALFHRPGHFGAALEVPRGRLTGVLQWAVLILAVALLAAAARSTAC